MLLILTTTAAVVTALSGLVVTVPQMVRVIRRGNATGVSLPGWVNWCISYTAWVLYLAGTGQVPLFIGCLGEALVCVTTTVVILRHADTFGDKAWWSTAAWFTTVTVALAANWAGFPVLISALLSCSPVWVYGPSAWKAWRSPDVSGIAPVTWALALTGALTFALAGHANPVTVTNGAVSATLSLAILARLALGQRWHPRVSRAASSGSTSELAASDLAASTVGQDAGAGGSARACATPNDPRLPPEHEGESRWHFPTGSPGVTVWPTRSRMLPCGWLPRSTGPTSACLSTWGSGRYPQRSDGRTDRPARNART